MMIGVPIRHSWTAQRGQTAILRHLWRYKSSTTGREGIVSFKGPTMKVKRIFTDPHGQTHFGTLWLPLSDKSGGQIGALSELLPGDGIFMRQTSGSYDYDWHNAPREQFVVNLDAAVDVTVSSGEKTRFGKGDMFFVQDVDGRGHVSKAVDATVRNSLFLPVARQVVESIALVPPIAELDIRVGRINHLSRHPDADRLYVEKIDVGEADGFRTIVSGLVGHYEPEDLQGRLVLVLCNMQPRKMRGIASHGMVLCGVSSDSSKVELVEPPADAHPGDEVWVDGYDFKPEAEKCGKKQLSKVWELVAGELTTGNIPTPVFLQGVAPHPDTGGDGASSSLTFPALYQGVPLRVKSGVCTVRTIAGGRVG